MGRRGQRGNVNRKKNKEGVWVSRDRPITFCVFGTVNMGSNQTNTIIQKLQFSTTMVKNGVGESNWILEFNKVLYNK